MKTTATAEATPPRLPPPDLEAGNYFVAAYPPFSAWSAQHIPALESALAQPRAGGIGLYVHLPSSTRSTPLACSSALGSAEFAANCIEDALAADDVSVTRLGAFEPAVWDGVETVRRLIHAFYDPEFSFTKFVERFPEQRRSLIDCLVGDVVKDMTPFREVLETMTSPPPPLTDSIPIPKAALAADEAV